MTPATKRPYEKPTLDAKEMFGAEGTTGSGCCKLTLGACSTATRSGLGKGSRTSAVS